VECNVVPDGEGQDAVPDALRVHPTAAAALVPEHRIRGGHRDAYPSVGGRLATVGSDALDDDHQAPSLRDAGRGLRSEHQCADDAEISAAHEPVVLRDAALVADPEHPTDLLLELVGALVQEAQCRPDAVQFVE
jgi:hypothetical protein